jgi:hypothetical protein
MASHARSLEKETEAQFIEGLRDRYEEQGFTFTVHPARASLPDFLGSYIPDAVAQKPGRNIAIEVKRRSGPDTERALRDIRRLFDGRPEWQFQVVFMGADPLQSMTIPTVTTASIRPRINEIRALIVQGHLRSAFVMAWSILEATVRALDGRGETGPLTPGTVVQTLATNGWIEPEMERRMRDLIALRNRVVHGDLAAEPARADVELILSAVEASLRADAAQN